jgi:hypothetical protein
MSCRIDAGLRDALVREAGEQGRSMANMLERLLADRYRRGAVLVERDQGAEGSNGRLGSAVASVPLGGGSTEPLPSPALSSSRSASAVPADGRCTMNTPKGVKCKFCGKVHQ